MLADGSERWLPIDEVEWLAKATPDAAANYELQGDRVVWPDLDNAWLTLDELDELAGGGTVAPHPEKLHVDVLAACAAAAMVFGTHEHDDIELPVARYDMFQQKPIRDVAQCAADFVRANPEVDAGVIPVQLKLKGFRPDEPVSPRELAGWTVFRAALLALDRMRAVEAAQAEAERKAAEPERRAGVPRDRLSFVPQDGALRPTGFSPSR